MVYSISFLAKSSRAVRLRSNDFRSVNAMKFVFKFSCFQIPVLVLTIGLADYRGRIITFRVFSGLASISLLLLIFCITSGNFPSFSGFFSRSFEINDLTVSDKYNF